MLDAVLDENCIERMRSIPFLPETVSRTRARRSLRQTLQAAAPPHPVFVRGWIARLRPMQSSSTAAWSRHGPYSLRQTLHCTRAPDLVFVKYCKAQSRAMRFLPRAASRSRGRNGFRDKLNNSLARNRNTVFQRQNRAKSENFFCLQTNAPVAVIPTGWFCV
jgi:hypothetical protein